MIAGISIGASDPVLSQHENLLINIVSFVAFILSLACILVIRIALEP